jgi:hypothetical protein
VGPAARRITWKNRVFARRGLDQAAFRGDRGVHSRASRSRLNAVKQKGAAVRGTLNAIAAIHGDTALERVMAHVSEDVRRALRPPVLASGWYEVSVVAAVHVAVRYVLGKGSWRSSFDLGVQAARHDLVGIHSAFLRALSTESVWSRTQNAWNHYHSQGRAEWHDQAPGSARGRIFDVEGFNEGMWRAVAGRGQTLLQMVGARGAMVEIVDPTPTECRFEADWLG